MFLLPTFRIVLFQAIDESVLETILEMGHPRRKKTVLGGLAKKKNCILRFLELCTQSRGYRNQVQVFFSSNSNSKLLSVVQFLTSHSIGKLPNQNCTTKMQVPTQHLPNQM